MITAVADTSPIRYLVRIGEISLLPRLFQQVILQLAVLDELRAEDGLPIVRQWAERLPEWVQVRSPTAPLALSIPNLHRGEMEAIALAEQLGAPLLLIDDRVGMRVALERGLTITGTLGVLVEAAQAGLVSIDQVVKNLQETNFRGSPGFYQRAFDLAHQRPPVLPRQKKD